MSTPLLALAATAAVVLDLVVAGAVSHADNGEALAELAPATLPANAFLSQQGTPHADLDGLRIEADVAEDGNYELVLTNLSNRDITANLRLQIDEISGSPMSRMGPVPMMVHAEEFDAPIAAGETRRHKLAFKAPKRAKSEAREINPRVLFGDFSETRLTVSTLGEQPQHAMLSTGGGVPIAIDLANFNNNAVAYVPNDVHVVNNLNVPNNVIATPNLGVITTTDNLAVADAEPRGKRRNRR